MEITSVNNDLVKEYSKLLQKKYRTATSKFLIEGEKALCEAINYGIELEVIFADKNKYSEYKFNNKVTVIFTNEKVLKKLSSTDSPPAIAAVAIQKKYNENILSNLHKVVLLENIKDAGNFGTIVRSSVAFGVEAIVLFGDCVDIYNPKCVRASVGNLWKIPIIHVSSIEKLRILFSNFTRIATLPKSSNMLKSYNPCLPLLIMFGSEADGLSDKLIEFSNESLKIEMANTVESLNLATSFAVITYSLFAK